MTCLMSDVNGPASSVGLPNTTVDYWRQVDSYARELVALESEPGNDTLADRRREIVFDLGTALGLDPNRTTARTPPAPGSIDIPEVIEAELDRRMRLLRLFTDEARSDELLDVRSLAQAGDLDPRKLRKLPAVEFDRVVRQLTEVAVGVAERLSERAADSERERQSWLFRARELDVRIAQLNELIAQLDTELTSALKNARAAGATLADLGNVIGVSVSTVRRRIEPEKLIEHREQQARTRAKKKQGQPGRR